MFDFWYIFYFGTMSIQSTCTHDLMMKRTLHIFPHISSLRECYACSPWLKGVHNELMDVRQQMDMRWRSNIIFRLWHGYIQFIEPDNEHPTTFHFSILRGKVYFHIPTCHFIWYLEVRCWLQLFDLVRIPSDLLSWDGKYGSFRLYRLILLVKGPWDKWRVSLLLYPEIWCMPNSSNPTCLLVTDYIRGLNSDHTSLLSPLIEFHYFEPSSSRYTQPSMYDHRQAFKAYALQGEVVEYLLQYHANENIRSVSSAGLCHQYQVRTTF